jgi:hypothetical protein
LRLVGAVARHERRVRLLFDADIQLSGRADTTHYRVTNEDALGVSLGVVGLVLVAGQPHVIDLVLGGDLVPGALYAVHVQSVLGSDGTVTPPGSRLPVRLGAVPAKPDVELDPDDIGRLLYGVDCVWTGTDYAEAPGGDLATVEGPENVRGAIERRCLADGLPWDDTYGARPREYIDGSTGAAPTLAGTLVRQAQEDDRVRRAKASFALDEADATFDLDVQLIGEGDAVSVPVVVKNAGD